MNRRDILAVLTAASGFLAGCSGNPSGTESPHTSPNGPSPSPAETASAIESATEEATTQADSEIPDILTSEAAYLDRRTIRADLVGKDNVGIASARISTSIDSIEEDGDGAESIELEANLDATPRESVRFVVEDQSGNTRTVTEAACFDAPLGKHLVKYGQSMELGWDEPEIVEWNGRYHLFYRIGGGGDEIALATSEDGVNWVENGTVIEQGADDAWDNNYVISPAYLHHDGTNYVFYEGNDGQISRIGWAMAEQIEGPYRKSEDNPVLVPERAGGFEDVLVGTPAVSRHNDGTVYLYYHGWDAEHDRLAVAKSENLIEWEKSPHNPIIDVKSGTWYGSKIAPSDVVRRNGTDYVLIEGDDGQHWRSGIALTDDPFEDIRLVDYNPVLTLGDTGSFDDTHAHTPSGLITGDDGGEELWVYYQGNDGSAYRLSRAKQPVC